MYSPTRNGAEVMRMIPAKALPRVCWAAMPRMTPVTAPESSSCPTGMRISTSAMNMTKR